MIAKLNALVGYVYGHSIIGLIINIGLGIVPYYLAKKMLKAEQSGKKVMRLFFTALFLLFLPNTLYLATEIRHWFIEDDLVAETKDVESFLFFLAISLFGVFATAFLIIWVTKKSETFKKLQSISIVFLTFCASFGTALGAFQRVNSYDILLDLSAVWAAIISVLKGWQIAPVIMVTCALSLILTQLNKLLRT